MNSFALTKPIREASQETNRDIYELLYYLGYFDFAVPQRTDEQKSHLWQKMKSESMTSEFWQSAITEYQEFSGVAPDGDYGPKTKAVLENRFCAVPDKLHPIEANAGQRKWPQDRLTFWMEPANNLVPNVVAHTIKAWNDVCGVELETYEDGEPGPNIYAYFRRIDGNSGTLAWSMLAYAGMPASKKLEQRFDAENWYSSTTPSNASGINLAAVSAHEMGHALGLEHISVNFAKALMNPIYSRNVIFPQQADINVVRGYFGPPKTTPTEPVDPVDPVDPQPPVELSIEKIVITANGKNHTLTK